MRTDRIGPAIALLLLAPAASADDEALRERIEQLELRIQDLEASQVQPREERSADWTRLVRLGGSVDAGYFGGQADSDFEPDSFQIWDTRLFVDGQVGDRIALGEQTIFRNVGLTFEWDLVRLGQLQNRVGEAFIDFQGVLGADALNAQVGRFQIPVGEAYLRYSRGRGGKPFVSDPVGAPWWWDEGVRFYGSDWEHRFGYVASISDGETPFNAKAGRGIQGTLRLFARPLPWLYASVSALHSGHTGSSSSPANGALWLGESWARALGSGTSVPTFQDGVALAGDGPNELKGTTYLGSDLILDFDDRIRLWFAYGRYEIDSRGGSFYDRVLQTWIAEMILRGAWISNALRPFYIGLRGSGLGTYDGNQGYLLDVRRGSTLGYNMESIATYAAVLGWELGPNVVLRAEYARNDIDLVDGVPASTRDTARNTDFFVIEAGASF